MDIGLTKSTMQSLSNQPQKPSLKISAMHSPYASLSDEQCRSFSRYMPPNMDSTNSTSSTHLQTSHSHNRTSLNPVLQPFLSKDPYDYHNIEENSGRGRDRPREYSRVFPNLATIPLPSGLRSSTVHQIDYFPSARDQEDNESQGSIVTLHTQPKTRGCDRTGDKSHASRQL